MVPRRRWLWVVAFIVALVFSVHTGTGQTTDATASLLRQSRQQYEAGQLNDAKALLQQVQQQARLASDRLTQAIALSNLALIESEQGQWAAANQAIAESLQLIQAAPETPTKPAALAQIFNVQGRLQLAQGDAQAALQTWMHTGTLYRQAHDATGELQSQLHQAQALQALGFYERASQDILQPLWQRLQRQPDSRGKVWALRSLGDAISITGSFKDLETKAKIQPETVIRESLTIAERLNGAQNDAQEIAASQLSLANLLAAHVRVVRSVSSLKSLEKQQFQSDLLQAIDLYKKVAAQPSPSRLRARLNHLALLVHLTQLVDVNFKAEAIDLAASLQPDISSLAPTRPGIEARLNFASSLLRFPQADRGVMAPLPDLLATAVDQAKALGDTRLLANALGNLGRVQEQNQRFKAAQATTERALLAAQAVGASDQVYCWFAQLGRLQESLNNKSGAIASYTQAIDTLPRLRADLLGITSETQLVDAETIEPVHYQLVSLLLPTDGSQPSQETLIRVRAIIESLQLEEINNYLRANCLQPKVKIDAIAVPETTAVIYPMILPDRIATVVSITEPQTKAEQQTKQQETKQRNKPEKLRLYTQMVDQKTVNATVQSLQEGLLNPISLLDSQQPGQQLYGWLIRPIEADLRQQKVETLVFVLGGALRTIPMAVLWDGEQFLIERYSLALSPGLKLIKPEPLQAKALSAVAFGLTKATTFPLPGGSKPFPALPYVQTELEELQKEIHTFPVARDENFTLTQFQETLQKSQAPIVHLATHGQFSSNRDQTFLVAFDKVIDTDQLAMALGTSNNSRTVPIELLVLSACETALGDDRAPLGLAGIALKSGARSTVASLWQVSDQATSLLIQQFYKELATRQVTKAEALRRAQLALLASDNPTFRYPYAWAAFILVGNWL